MEGNDTNGTPSVDESRVVVALEEERKEQLVVAEP